MAREWTDEEVQKEIREAVQIVREDRIDKMLRTKFGSSSNDPANPPTNPPTSGGNPNPNDKKKKSIWWGETE